MGSFFSRKDKLPGNDLHTTLGTNTTSCQRFLRNFHTEEQSTGSKFSAWALLRVLAGFLQGPVLGWTGEGRAETSVRLGKAGTTFSHLADALIQSDLQ